MKTLGINITAKAIKAAATAVVAFAVMLLPT
jgi:hypothetical protein